MAPLRKTETKNSIAHLMLLLVVLISSCHAQEAPSELNNSDWALQTESLSKETLDKHCQINVDQIQRIQKDSANGCDLYYLNGKLFTGWACEVIPDHKHRYRYEQFENGKMIRRIAYYDNGLLDADFRMKNCKNYGPSRMWLYDGKLYIDEFYIAPGIRHGLQRQWHDNGVLAREAEFDNEKLIFERHFDRSGKEITAK